jgi:hypothetical protein
MLHIKLFSDLLTTNLKFKGRFEENDEWRVQRF